MPENQNERVSSLRPGIAVTVILPGHPWHEKQGIIKNILHGKTQTFVELHRGDKRCTFDEDEVAVNRRLI